MRFPPADAFNTSRRVISQDESGNDVGGPFFEFLYQNARANPSPRALGDFVERHEQWFGRGATCFSQSVTGGPGFRAANGVVAQAVRLGPVVAPDINATTCERVRHDPALGKALELAKRGLLAWVNVKAWEILHSKDLEDRSATLTDPVCAGDECVDASEPRGWVTNDMDVFNRAPHYLAYNSKEFVDQDALVGRYHSTTWYHLQMVLNPGYRRTAPSHFVYTIGHVENLHEYANESQSFRFWAGMIKMRQQQTNGLYGVEAGLDLRTAQPFKVYSDRNGDTSVRAGVGMELWRRLAEAMLFDLVGDAANATQAEWDAANQNREVHDRDSREFSPYNGSGRLFPDDELQGLNTARVIPLLRDIGVSETVVGHLLDWCEKMWLFGPWDELRTP